MNLATDILWLLKKFLKYFSETNSEALASEKEENQARRRWTIISIVKHSDTQADQTAKKEKLKVKFYLRISTSENILKVQDRRYAQTVGIVLQTKRGSKLFFTSLTDTDIIICKKKIYPGTEIERFL